MDFLDMVSSVSSGQNFWMHCAVFCVKCIMVNKYLMDWYVITIAGSTHTSYVCVVVCTCTGKKILVSVITKHSATHAALLVIIMGPQRDRVIKAFSESIDLKHEISVADEFAQHMQTKRDITSRHKWILLSLPDLQVFIVQMDWCERFLMGR